MKKYKFRLDNVLRVRRTEEDLAKAELARANARVADAVALVDLRLSHYAALPVPAGAGSTANFMANRFRQESAARAVVAAKAARVSAMQDAEAAVRAEGKKIDDTVNLRIIPQTLALNEKFQEMRSEIGALTSLLTMVGGRIVYAAGPYEGTEEKP